MTFCYLLVNPHGGIQRERRFLGQQCEPVSPQLAPRGGILERRALPTEGNESVNLKRAGQAAHQCVRQQRFTAAAFTDERHRPAGFEQ
ncbi:hypothetical protein [Arthrobacter sp. 35/47]|uniref:hypothetical protein n=1 Tax=Arthrobacter sp. 35/47 TaxID=269454 RepID=UPI00047E9416|nr:hypothetical protein [Arthrobacter sp. 35/47]